MKPRAIRQQDKSRCPWRLRAKSTPASDDDTTPLNVMVRLMLRCCDVIAAEDQKGAGADKKRIDRALDTAAALARGAAPYYHRRMKPADLAPGEPRKREIIVSWTPPKYANDNTPPSAPRDAGRPGEP